MTELRLASPARGAEGAGQFKTLKRLAAARATPALVRALDRVFGEFAREEADRVTRQWFSSQREAAGAAGELADLTLAYYENALRKFRPYYELDYARGREERTCRYQGGPAFLRWLGRQRAINTRALRVLFAVPAARVQIQIQAGRTADRSFLWAAATHAPLVERLVAALDAALAAENVAPAWRRSWNFNISLAGAISLLCAAGLALHLRPRPWPTALAAALVVDVALALGLVFLFRVAWPNVILALAPATKWAVLGRWSVRAGYVAAAAALALTGLGLLFTAFFRIVW